MEMWAYREFWRLWELSTGESRVAMTQNDFAGLMEKGSARPAAGGQVEDLRVSVTSPPCCPIRATAPPGMVTQPSSVPPSRPTGQIVTSPLHGIECDGRLLMKTGRRDHVSSPGVEGIACVGSSAESGPPDPQRLSRRTGFCNAPIPWISSTATSPSFKKRGGFRAKPTPPGVPVAMTSPGSRVKMWEQ